MCFGFVCFVLCLAFVHLLFFGMPLSKGTMFQYLELSLFFLLAEQVTNNLKELAQQVTPGDIVSTYGVRKAMGISIPSAAMENNFVDLTEDIEEPKKTDVAECGPGGS